MIPVFTALTRCVSALSEVAEVVWPFTAGIHGGGSFNGVNDDRPLSSGSLTFPSDAEG
jgi:hypothetical protein